MGKLIHKIAVAGVAAVASTIVGKIIYTRTRYKKISPKPLKKLSELVPENEKEIHLTAHRGLSAICPENTAVSFEAAGEKGFFALECDTHCTTDGTWVVLHDSNLKTMLDSSGDVKSYSYDELLKMNIANGANIENYVDLKICTLQQYIDICKKYNCRPMIEIKDKRVEKMKDLYALLEKNDIQKSAIIISFYIEDLKEMLRIDSNLETWYLVHYITQKNIDQAIDAGKSGVAFCATYNADRPEWIKKIHSNGLCAACWTVDTPELLQKMLDADVKYITTNSILPE
ncbi:MAG: glycerophosphodiester phosphodiesterase family protein [Oscillospiraceae bacterium]